jgi:hypothetical protein
MEVMKIGLKGWESLMGERKGNMLYVGIVERML